MNTYIIHEYINKMTLHKARETKGTSGRSPEAQKRHCDSEEDESVEELTHLTWTLIFSLEHLQIFFLQWNWNALIKGHGSSMKNLNIFQQILHLHIACTPPSSPKLSLSFLKCLTVDANDSRWNLNFVLMIARLAVCSCCPGSFSKDKRPKTATGVDVVRVAHILFW